MSYTVVIFGASGDLTARKLIPALFELHRKERLPRPMRIVGFSRTPMSDEDWRKKLEESTRTFLKEAFDPALWETFAPLVHYHAGDIENADSFISLEQWLRQLESEGSEGAANRLYYLSTAPQFYAPAIEQLGNAGMSSESEGNSRRVVIEKPFGTDLESARKLNESIHRVFAEHQIYRIDHYLGKETVNNVLVFRFANTIFEPVWNRNYIEHIQITAGEDVVVGRRAPYYEKAGVLRDMFQNHLLQLLTLTTMEAPSRFEAQAVRDEKVKVLRAIRAMSPAEVEKNTVRGQYRTYRNEAGVAPGSLVATFGAVKLMIDNWRWKDVPVYLRSGKGMSCRTTQILIQFRQPPHIMFQGHSASTHPANRLLIQIQPAEGIQLHFLTKVPDTEMKMRLTEFNFNFSNSFKGELPEAYQRLLLDAILGDASLFARSDEVEAAWDIIDPIQKTWDSDRLGDPDFYEIGSWGPGAASKWIEQQGHHWFDLCPIV